MLHSSFFIKQNGQGLEVLQVALRVVVEDDAGVEQAVGVEDAFHLLHALVGAVAPFVAHSFMHS